MFKKIVLQNKRFHEKEYPTEELLSLVNDKLDFNTKNLPHTWLPLIYKFLFEEEKIYWDKEIIDLTYHKINKIHLIADEKQEFQDFVTMLSQALEYLFISLSSFNDIVKNITLRNDNNISEEVEFRMYYIPLYNSIIEGCWTNLLKFWRNLLNFVDEKNLLPQNKLHSLVETINKRGLEELTKNIDVDIRNAINHGGIFITDEKTAIFQYSKGKDGVQTKQVSLYNFRRVIFNLIDVASSTYLGIIKYFCQKNIDFDFLSKFIESEFVYDSLVKLEISSYLNSCQYIFKSQTINDEQQINLKFYTDELTAAEKLEFSIFTFLKLYLYYPEVNRYFITFSSERCLPSFISANSADVAKLYNRELNSLEDLTKLILQNNTPLLNEPYLEDINISEAKKNVFSNIKSAHYEVTDIKDISMENGKRFKANVYIVDAYRRNHIKTLVTEIIEKLTYLKNYPNLKHKTKFGDMPADLVQLTLYKVKAREGRREKHLISSNENFIATVQNYSDIKFKLTHTSLKEKIWRDLKFRTEGNIEYGWNPQFGNK